MQFEKEDIIKINGIELHARNDDWGQSGKKSDNQVLLTDESSSQATNCQLDAVDFRIEAYYVGADYKEVVSKLYRIYKQQKNMLLEHNDVGRVWVKFSNGGYRVKKTQRRLWYREFVLNLVKANAADLKIQVVEVQQLAEVQLKKEAEQSLLDFLSKFNADFIIDNITSLVKNETVNNLYALADLISGYGADNLLGGIINPFVGTFENMTSMAGGIGGTILSYLLFGRSKNDRKYTAEETNSEDAKKYYHTYIDIADKADINLKDADPEVAQNTQAAIDLIKQAAIVKACESVADSPFDTKDEIEQAIKELERISDKIIHAAENDKNIQNDIHNTVNRAVGIMQSHPVCNAKQVVKNISLPAIVICHDEHCNEAAFLKNNKIRHPLFVPAGVKLEVISND